MDLIEAAINAFFDAIGDDAPQHEVLNAIASILAGCAESGGWSAEQIDEVLDTMRGALHAARGTKELN